MAPFLFRNTQSSSTGPQVGLDIATSFDYREIGQEETQANKATISPSPGNRLVDKILLTGDPDYALVDLEIEATLRGKSLKEIMKTLNNRSTLSSLAYKPDDHPDTGEIFIDFETAERLKAFIPFTKACQNSFGEPSVDGEVDLFTKNRTHFNGYIKYQYDRDKPTEYDPQLARESSEKRKKAAQLEHWLNWHQNILR